MGYVDLEESVQPVLLLTFLLSYQTPKIPIFQYDNRRVMEKSIGNY